jgi:hypothetical protein
MVARPTVTGYIRMLNLPSCARCVVLAGQFYRWNQGFLRHPECDCRHIPATENVAGDLRTNALFAIASGKVRGMSKADTKAILEDGADPAQVINAHRGMQTAQVYGRKLKFTTEGVTKRGLAGKRLGEFAKTKGSRYQRSKVPRLMPESIYRIAKDRDDAIRLLKRFGYIV